MLVQRGGSTLPGWRDFERTVAMVFGGEAQENKAIFDVLVPTGKGSTMRFGISCKMRRELNKLEKTGRVSFELSNSSGYFWSRLRSQGISPKNYLRKPTIVGKTLIGLVESWHYAVSIQQGGMVDLDKSFYFGLLWNADGLYQLYQFPIYLPKSESLKWRFSTSRCLKGDDRYGTIFEWYGESGGQLKYYPLARNATWYSRPFRLEPIKDLKSGMVAKVSGYFPELWSKVTVSSLLKR
jgi:hypothetical protein